MQSDPRNQGRVLVAEAAATIKRISLEDGTVEQTYSGPAAPLTSIYAGSSDMLLFAGCWDKNLWQFPPDDSPTKSTGSPVLYAGHTDFVKCVLIVPLADSTSLLISGGADGLIMFWSPRTSSTVPTNISRPLHTINPVSRSIESLALDPYSDPSSPTVYFSTSTQLISSFSLPSSLDPISALKSTTTASLESSLPLFIHDTSVYQLHFDHNADLWSCSADKTAKHCPRNSLDIEPSHLSPSSHQPATFEGPDTTLQHPDFVRSILTTDPSTCGYFHAITACRDENVRVWNASTGDLLHVYSGHYDEVTSLCLVVLPSLPGLTPPSTASHDKRKQLFIASASIDGTIRTWDASPPGIASAKEEEKAAATAVGHGQNDITKVSTTADANTATTATTAATETTTATEPSNNTTATTNVDDKPTDTDILQTNEFGLTAEEEAELRAMMGDEETESLEKQAKGEQ